MAKLKRAVHSALAWVLGAQMALLPFGQVAHAEPEKAGDAAFHMAFEPQEPLSLERLMAGLRARQKDAPVVSSFKFTIDDRNTMVVDSVQFVTDGSKADETRFMRWASYQIQTASANGVHIKLVDTAPDDQQGRLQFEETRAALPADAREHVVEMPVPRTWLQKTQEKVRAWAEQKKGAAWQNLRQKLLWLGSTPEGKTYPRYKSYFAVTRFAVNGAVTAILLHVGGIPLWPEGAIVGALTGAMSGGLMWYGSKFTSWIDSPGKPARKIAQFLSKFRPKKAGSARLGPVSLQFTPPQESGVQGSVYTMANAGKWGGVEVLFIGLQSAALWAVGHPPAATMLEFGDKLVKSTATGMVAQWPWDASVARNRSQQLEQTRDPEGLKVVEAFSNLKLLMVSICQVPLVSLSLVNPTAGYIGLGAMGAAGAWVMYKVFSKNKKQLPAPSEIPVEYVNGKRLLKLSVGFLGSLEVMKHARHADVGADVLQLQPDQIVEEALAQADLFAQNPQDQNSQEAPTTDVRTTDAPKAQSCGSLITGYSFGYTIREGA